MTRIAKGLIGFVSALFLFQASAALAGETYQKTMGNVTFDAELDTHSLVTDFAYSNVICKAGKPNVDDWLALVKTRDPAIAASTEERVARSGETYSFVTLTGESGSGFYNENTGTFKYATLLGEQVNTMIAYYADSGADEIFHGSDLSFLSIPDVIHFVNQQTPTLMEELTFDAYFNDYEVFPLSVDILNQINQFAGPAMDEMAELGKELPRKEKWTQADECYYLLLREEVQGVPFFPNEFWPVNGVGNSVSPPWAEAIVSANGFEYIEISGIWEPISIVERGFAMSLDQACDNYATFHGSLLGEESFTVNRIVFAYVPMLMDNEHFFAKIEYRPAFIFHRSDRGMAEAFDAISGELLSWME